MGVENPFLLIFSLWDQIVDSEKSFFPNPITPTRYNTTLATSDIYCSDECLDVITTHLSLFY